MKKIKNMILVFIIVIIITCILFITFIINRNNQELSINEIGDKGESINYDTMKIERVTDKIKFYTVSDCINEYFKQINNKNNEIIYSLLCKEYIQKNEVNDKNIYKYVDNIEEVVVFVPLKMNVLRAYNVQKYVVYGFIEDSNNKFVKNIYLIVNLDVSKKSFSIEPILKGEYNNLDDINIVNQNIEIEENEYNKYNDRVMTYEETAKEYFEVYKKIVLANPELLYNEFLDEEYRNKKFNTIELFKEYIKNNEEEISNSILSKYKVNEFNNYTQYIIIDNYNNYYTLNEENVMNFKIILDNYTINSEEFEKKYKTATDDVKIATNIDKVFKLINEGQYKEIYNYLNSEFRENYFKDFKSFELYMKNKFFDYNYLGQITTEKQGIYYIIDVPYKNGISSAAEEREVKIIMKLNENMDFEMSFETE